MSHTEQQLPSPDQPSASPTNGYGATSSSTFSSSSRQPQTPRTPVSQLAQSVASTDMMGPYQVTRVERWAMRASDSRLHATAGAIGGFTSGVVTCPLDVIKTKLQAQGGFAGVQKGKHVGHHKVYSGLVGTASVIWKEEGIRGMYRGLGPIILGYLPTWAVWFTVYNKSKVWMRQYHKNDLVINFWSSIIAGASSTVVTNPIWVIKTRLMSQTPYSRAQYSVFPKGSNTPTSRPTLHASWHYRSTVDAARKMYTTEGITSFYSGLTPALLGLTHVAVQFPAYEYLKLKFTGRGMGDAPVDSGEHPAHWFGVLSASILSKILASSATYPHEVIRTRLQTQRRPAVGVNAFNSEGNTQGESSQKTQQRAEPKYRGILMTFRTILREEGWRAFYAGMGTNMFRAVPAATVTMLTYEYVMQTLTKARIEGKQKTEATNERTGFS